jgi:hypothetical protein
MILVNNLSFFNGGVTVRMFIVHSHEHKLKIILCNQCLPYSKEGGLISRKLHECCPPNAPYSSSVLEPIWYDMHEY